ncbi:MAG: PD-(D/E)XK nuclease family protein [Actinomycetota bacterium]|nr:PD-(D/E)XK nuclease family protein [Actinomycetota bacterium]
MTLHVRFVPHGPPAAEALRAAIVAAKGSEPLAPVTVVVPSNHVGVATRRLLASGALGPVTSSGSGVGIAAVTFVTTFRLAELLGANAVAAQGRRPVSTPVLAAAMRAELADNAGLFTPVAEHPATESALVATYRELRDLSPGALDALAATGERAAEVVRLHRAVRARLAPEWSDEEDLLLVATEVVRAGGAEPLGAVVVHLPERLTQHAAGLLRAVADQQPTTVIAATTGDPAADAEVRRSLSLLGADGPTAPVPLPVDGSRTRIVTASDGDEEVRTAVRAVVDAVQAGTRLDRIAVLHATPEPYARLTHEQLHAAGMPTNGAAVLPLSARLAGRTLLELLQLPRGDFRRQDVFAWLTAAPVLHEGRWAPTTAWERISRDAAVIAGRADWEFRLSQYAAKQHQRIEAYAKQDDIEPWKVEHAQADADRALALQAFVLGTIDDLRRADRPKRWSEHARWAQRTIDRLLGAADRRHGWPLDEQRAAERVELALQRLGALDAIEGPVPLEVFERTLEVELEADLGRVGRFGDGVLVGSIEMGIGLDLDLLVIVGLAEGSFPSTVRDDSLLPDRERAATAGELAPRVDRIERQHRHLLGALAGARRQLLCVPRGDLRKSADRTPSRWVLDIASALAGTRWWSTDLLHREEPWLHHVASFDAGLRTLHHPATAQEHRLRALLAAGGELHAFDDPATRQGAMAITARRSDRFTRFDGNLAGLAVPSPAERLTSATRLERWADCPFAHLVEDVLSASPVENPEDALMITPLDRGNLVHEALELFLTEVLQRPAEARPGSRTPWTPADHERLEQIGAALCDRYEALGLTGRPIFWKRDRRHLLDDLADFLYRDSVHRLTHGTSPHAVELAFGFDEGGPPIDVPLPDGRALRIRGRVDRIDVADDGTVHVVDYKTGKPDSYRGLTEEEPIAAGTRLQLPIYGLAARQHVGRSDAPVRAEYWFATKRGRYERIGYPVTEGVLATTGEVLGTIVTSIEAGVFASRPEKDKSTSIFIDCHACDPDGLGTVDLRRSWDRKRDDPALRTYAELAEPPAAEEVPG